MRGKILVVDDEEALVRLLTYNLKKEGFITIPAYDGVEALQKITEEKPDLIILDLMLPGKDGLEICREVRAQGVKTPIIMLTARDEEIDKVVGLEMGADDYVTKPFSVRELSARVKAVLRRNRQMEEKADASSIITVGEFALKSESYEVYYKDKLLELTLKEYELLELLIKNRGRVLKRDYLLQVLWDYAEPVNTRVLDVHISKLREKIEPDSKNPRYIKTIRGVGYKFEVSGNA
ncbi:response regulator transcription factor [Syntrophomonas wolfei]|jgi:two-component system alkaline phosphatase synthesis response regulator PhoP|nr:response regulator transcription factor [Syntrophomonas wolfei]